LAHVETEDAQKQTSEYPTPAPSSRLVNRKLSIPPRPQHEDSSDSLLERTLIDEQSTGQSSLREGSTAENHDVHPAFQSTLESINTLLETPNAPAPAHTTLAAQTPVESQHVVSSSTTTSITTTTTPTHTPASTTPHQLDSVEPMLAALEQRTKEDIPRTPTGPAPAIAPITDSSREIRSALENYTPEMICAQCNQTIQGRHLLALDKHWRILFLPFSLSFSPCVTINDFSEITNTCNARSATLQSLNTQHTATSHTVVPAIPRIS
jgi:hypothetical protein